MPNTLRAQRKSFVLLTIALCAVLALALAACAQKSTFSDEIDEATGAFTLTAENTEAKTAIGALGSSIELGEDQVIAFDAHIKKGAVNVRFLDGNGDLALEQTVDSEGLVTCGLPAGGYSIGFVCAENGTTGTVTVVVVDDEALASSGGDLQRALAEMQRWTKASSAAEAAQGAGFEEFVLPDPDTQLQNGPTGAWTIKYEQARIEARGYSGAADLTVMKGVYAGNGDISGIDRSYPYEWTCDIDGMEVRCAGSTEGRASKTVWISGNYSYCILVHGQGDMYDTFGLGEDDIATLVSIIR